MKREERRTAKLQAQCDDFNTQNPVGTSVDVRKDSGETIRTITVSAAEVLGGHTPVIWLRDIRGCYALERVTPTNRKGRTA
jgi:hypothetical protein